MPETSVLRVTGLLRIKGATWAFNVAVGLGRLTEAGDVAEPFNNPMVTAPVATPRAALAVKK